MGPGSVHVVPPYPSGHLQDAQAFLVSTYPPFSQVTGEPLHAPTNTGSGIMCRYSNVSKSDVRGVERRQGISLKKLVSVYCKTEQADSGLYAVIDEQRQGLASPCWRKQRGLVIK